MRSIPTRVMRGRTSRAGFGGTLVNWIFALSIASAIGLVLVHLLADGDVAEFFDQLVVSGLVAFGIVKTVF